MAATLRNNNVKKLGEQPFDVLVVGGGINGAVAAAFVQSLRDRLEHPATLFIE